MKRISRMSRSRAVSLRPMPTLAAVLIATPALAADYQPRETFAPRDMGQAVNVYRSSNGAPGPEYWQNRVDYQIKATLDTKTPSLSGQEVIAYTNNSPDALSELWLQLDQNMYKPESRAVWADGEPSGGSTDGYVLDEVTIEHDGKTTPVSVEVTDTRGRIHLSEPLAAKGGKVKIHIRYHFTIPDAAWGGRMGWGEAKAGPIYSLAQWYPRMQVYDDIRGWDTLPFLAQEFYLEYGNFDYEITVPSTMIVAGSGELKNADEVLTKEQRARLDKARASDKTVAIISPDEIGDAATRPKKDGTLTWHFEMKNTRDIALSISAAFAWDAARINLPDGKSALATSFYPAESQSTERWGRSTEYLKDAVERFSARWYPYPWPVAVNVAGPDDIAGMEYPGLLFDGISDEGKDLFWVTAHEIGHTWFPMVVGFDERRDAWMDEGFNTFIDVYESDDFNHGEYAPKRDSEYAPKGGNPADEILAVLADPDAPVILSRADTIIEKYRHPVTYFKSAFGLILLREQILGPDRFDPAFREFIAAWAFKHPKPADFFRFMDSAAGEDLSWWWRGWYDNNWSLDLAVEKVEPAEGDAAKGTTITIAAKDKLILPATLRVDFSDGSHRDYRLPAESFIRHDTTAVTTEAGKTVTEVHLDPDHKLPDSDRANNDWKAGAK